MGAEMHDARTGRSRLVTSMSGVQTTIFAQMSALATRTGSLNLGQGFPDGGSPPQVLQAARTAIAAGANQYAPGRGIPALREAIAQHQEHWYGLHVDPATQVLVTTGATEALAASILALVGPGDEVVALDPAFDSYAPIVARAGGAMRSVPLRAPDFSLDVTALADAFTDRTVLVILNSPHNPTGRVLTEDELTRIAQLASRHDAVVLSDEVYEHLTFDGHRHIPMATLPGMAERTLTVGSAGKTFAVTGWKIGWITGPDVLVDDVLLVKQYLTYTSGAPLQPAVALGLADPPESFTARADDLARRRDLLAAGLTAAGLPVLGPPGHAQAGYFLIADAAGWGELDGLDLCWRLPEIAGVVAIPVSVFCAQPARMSSLLRFAFCKSAESIAQACQQLAAARPG